MRRLQNITIPCLVLLAFLLAGCRLSGGPANPEGEPGGEGAAPAFGVESTGMDFVEEFLIFLGADRPSARALMAIRDSHDLAQWTHPVRIPDAVERCREAVTDLADSDYETWDDTAIAVWVVSTMSVRDPSALVRDDCVSALRWFREWVHPTAAGIGAGVRTTEEDVARALRVLQDLHQTREPHATASDRLVCMDAIAILGSHPWDALTGDSPAVIRTRLSRPRGVIRFLTAPGLDADRADPVIRDTLDRALIRLTDQLVILSEMAALADRSSHVRASAARALAEAADPAAIGPLAYALADEARDEVEMEMIQALGTLARGRAATVEGAIAALGERLADPVPSIRSAAARALESITGEDRGTDPAAWQRWWVARGEAKAPR